jgi:hypothetical protein
LHEWSEIPDLRRIIPSHGDIVDQPEQALEKMAEELA